MKYILQGIGDYCRDCWHDWLRNRVMAYGGRVYDHCSVYDHANQGAYGWVLSDAWKEGSVWHYLIQRKLTQKDNK